MASQETVPVERFDLDHQTSRQAGPLDRIIGARIRAHREALGLSSRKLGQRLGVTAQQVTNYETGRSRVPAATLFRISDVLDVPIGLLFPLERKNRNTTHGCIRGIMAEIAGVTDRRFLSAVLSLIAAAKDFTAVQPPAEIDCAPKTQRVGRTGPG